MPAHSTYTAEIGDIICQRIADGESLRAICRDKDMPNTATVMKWLMFGDAATVVEVMNAYPDLRAHIEAQAATIARLRFLVQSAYYEGWEDAQDACSANVLFTSNSLDDWEISTSRAALTGAA